VEPAPAPPAAPPAAEAAPRRAAPAGLAAGLAAVWRRGRPTVDARLATLDAAVAASGEGRITGEMREEAEREAHRLAGALGTFGSEEGSHLARELETAFGAGFDAAAAARLGPTVGALRACVVGLDAALADEPASAAPTPKPETQAQTPAAATVAAAPAGTEAVTPTGVRVLVVDEDAEFVAALRAEGERRGIAVEGIAAGDVMARAEAAPPSALVMDLSASDEEGEAWLLLSQVARRLPAVPVLVLAARGSLLDRVRILQLGGRMFLQKPLPAAEVLDAVLRQLPRAGASGRKVLAVDDDPSILQAVRTLLEPQGYAVHTLDSPLRFWSTLKSVEPDLLVLDVDMPFLNGIELCRVVRGDHRYAALPVLFLTARTDAETILRVFAAGADDYVTKPVVGPELSARVRNRLERAQRA
jgi:DNA-binding response OmpR family regulator/HPt (histidine-containing phosphotransfer) domain-containing protein